MQFNLPTLFTLLRIVLIPGFVGVFFLPVKWANTTSAAMFGLAALTDWLDGYLARRRKQVTPFGQFVDPLADKLLVLAALISLVQMELAPPWMVWTIIGREFAVTALRSIAYARDIVIPPSPLGKAKMVAQVVAVLALILGRDHLGGFLAIGQAALWVVVVAALVSAVDYFRRINVILNPRLVDVSAAERGNRKAG